MRCSSAALTVMMLACMLLSATHPTCAAPFYTFKAIDVLGAVYTKASPAATGVTNLPAPYVDRGIAVVIITRSAVKVHLTDPLGRVTGFDFNAGVSVANIPTSLLLDGDSPAIFITDGIQGTYQLDVVGTGSGGAFKLDIDYPTGFPVGFDSIFKVIEYG